MTDHGTPVLTRVLIVEDDPAFRLPLRATLVSLGFGVIAVDSAEAAETVLDRDAVDVVLTDLGLPGMDGTTLAARHPGIPFVLMTGSPPDHAARLRPASVVARLVKPFEVHHLLRALGEAVDAAGAVREGRGP